MQMIVITSPEFFPGEASLINSLMSLGIDRLHLRKPGAPAEAHRQLLQEIEPRWYSRVVLHDCHELVAEYEPSLGGIHLNSRNPHARLLTAGQTVSASCHSLGELRKRLPQLDYAFLSPIFNSISKQGYPAAYTPGDLQAAADEGLIGSRVVALGGVDMGRVPQLAEWHFGGAAVLGDLWNRSGSDLMRHAERLLEALKAFPPVTPVFYHFPQ